MEKMNNYQLVVDVWEGQLEVDEKVMKDNGVAAFIVRLNDMAGGHHKDTGFDKQWSEVQNFIRAPYFVYNPWVDGRANFDWLNRNAPITASIFADIEVRYPNYGPDRYANEVGIFVELCQKNWSTKIYSGWGYQDLLLSWPKNVDYWWARYKYLTLYPDQPISMTWGVFKSFVDTIPWIGQDCNNVGPIKLWQITGDRLILPGSTKILDVSIFNGSYDELASWFGYRPIEERVASLEKRVSIIEGRLGI